jgi:hypothetical protein
MVLSGRKSRQTPLFDTHFYWEHDLLAALQHLFTTTSTSSGQFSKKCFELPSCIQQCVQLRGNINNKNTLILMGFTINGIYFIIRNSLLDDLDTFAWNKNHQSTWKYAKFWQQIVHITRIQWAIFLCFWAWSFIVVQTFSTGFMSWT